jgi:lysophospholipase L1-like esterase
MRYATHLMTIALLSVLPLVSVACGQTADAPPVEPKAKPIKVFILAGDEMVLEQGVVNGRTDGIHQHFYPNAKRTQGEKIKHVNAAVYKGNFGADTDFEKLEPVATAIVEIGDQRTRRADPKKRGRVPVEMAPFPEVASKPGHTTVIRGYVTVKFAGKYEFRPGEGASAFNLTTVEGTTAYQYEAGASKPTITPIQLMPGKRYAFHTVFFKQPGHAFRLPLTNKPGTLTTTVATNPKYAFLRDKNGKWVTRDDVVRYDAQPIHNNTEAPAAPITVDRKGGSGPELREAIGVDLMLAHRLGTAIDQPILIIRYGVKHPIWFRRGSRSLAHDFRPPSSGGGSDLDGSWDVIHFNFGVWDATYRDATSKYFSGHNITSVKDYEKNLRTMIAKMKKTGATLIYATVTPVWEGEPGRRNADEDAYNKVAKKVMAEMGVIVNDLNAETRRQGFPKSNNVHSVGNLEPKVTQTIQEALAKRKQSTKPLPRVLFIGDSITGSYWAGTAKKLDGKAKVFKNPGNAEDTWNGLERIDEWLDLKRYLLNGQEYLELVDGVKKVIGDELERAYPGYAGQGVELAGLIWFQGLADAGSKADATQYQKNLANLITDLREDLNAPTLPVVIAAIAHSNQQMHTGQQAVFDAQLAIGDPKQYPQFVGNVAVIDTRPFWRPHSQSPGGRDPYRGNAQSYLDIGSAMGQAMLKLLGKQ